MQVSKLKRENLRDAVVRLIEQALQTGELQPGDRIVEADLAQSAGISRGPVREAIHQLVGEGILVTHPSRGTTVVEWTSQEVQEAYSLRAALEQFAVQEAVKHITSDDIVQLQAIVDEMYNCVKLCDIHALARLDVQFHEQLYKLSGHSLLQSMLFQLRRQLHCLHTIDQGYLIHMDEVAAIHQPIVAALSQRDAATASRLLKQHILAVGEQVVAQIKQCSQVQQ